MRLVKLRLQNYRRFEKASVDLNEDLVALVGPNEAGKSSLLHALELLGELKPPNPGDITRGRRGPARIAGLFVFDEEDRTVAKSIERCGAVERVWVEISSDAQGSTWEFDPTPSRDLGPRHECEPLIKMLEDDPAVSHGTSTDPEQQWDPDLWARVLKTLLLDNEDLQPNQIGELGSLVGKIAAVEEISEEDQAEETRSESAKRFRKMREGAVEALQRVANLEREAAPADQLIGALDGRLPALEMFGELDRELKSTYVLEEAVNEQPRPLVHLCALAGIDLAMISAAVSAGQNPHLEAVFEQANARLKARFQDTWKQSKVFPRFAVPHDGVLRIVISVGDGADYTDTDERSDGLRWFIALHAFLVAKGASNPVLLVDEAETHLHYDAQADLIDALMSQRLARKVVYSTHSIGCLPPDLGRGVRAVIAESDDRSAVANSYWSVTPADTRKVGYAPLLFAMGASLLPLTIPRFGVVVEGPADAVLLPTLIREATRLSSLAYRLVPGLSEIEPAGITALKQSAGRVACLTDSDAGGAAIQAKLLGGGMPKKAIFDLKPILENCTLEDLVERSVFAEAVNIELATWGLGSARVQEDDLPETGRWSWLEEWGAASGTRVESLSKVRVAQRVVDLGRSETPCSLLDAKYAASMRRLHTKIEKFLEVAAG